MLRPSSSAAAALVVLTTLVAFSSSFVGVGARPGPARPREFATSVGAADVTKVVGVADATKVVGVGEEKRAEEGDGGVWAGLPQPGDSPQPRPLIGILSQPRDWEGIPEADGYIAASYVKFVEAAGARAVPISFNETERELTRVLRAVNGVIFPGGDSNISAGTDIYRTASRILRFAREASEAGDRFPVWGTCMGFQLMSSIVSGDPNLLTAFDGADYASRVEFVGDATARSRLLGALPEAALKALSERQAVYENHEFGVSPQAWARDDNLVATFGAPLAVDHDHSGRAYVALIEGQSVPFYGTQFHPEKAMAEWDPKLNIPHDADAVAVAQALANFFVGEARTSKHAPASMSEEDAMLIYNYQTTYAGRGGYDQSSYSQVYLFKYLRPVAESDDTGTAAATNPSSSSSSPHGDTTLMSDN